MIKNISIKKIASYKELVEINPKKINYFFGSNGTGKTVFGNIISDICNYPTCEIEWDHSAIQIHIYNKSFVDSNFRQNDEIKGIFTLGKDASEAQKFIEEKNSELSDLKKKTIGLKKTQIQKEKELSERKVTFQEKAWEYKKKYENNFRPAFKGFMGSKTDFMEKCLIENSRQTPVNFLPEVDLFKKCNQIFKENYVEYPPISFDFELLKDKENSEILKKKIVGKDDIELSKLIKRLNNSDWVKEGIDYLGQSEGLCPFCQQLINIDLKREIESFFDDTYSKSIAELNTYVEKYITYVSSLIDKLESVASKEHELFDVKNLNTKILLLKEQFKNNCKILESKKRSPSSSVNIESLVDTFNDILQIISEYNDIIRNNNNIKANLDKEKEQLLSEIWHFLTRELSIEIASFLDSKKDIESALQSISESLNEGDKRERKLNYELGKKESELTSVKHSANEINKILALFGFTNFKLAEADTTGFYKLLREDGSEAKETLSEGEYTFLTYLYFYHMVYGSDSETGIGKDKVIIIDDPISSLDSSVLFIVSNLTKRLVQDIRAGQHGFEQIFILSHNVYFFKEVTFKCKGNNKLRDEAYWTIRKFSTGTKIIEHESNPIKTSYELLWRELDNTEDINSATIFNTLRRILEYYFNILGGLDYDAAINSFEGEELILCQSLLSWINDGSHFINDDLVVDSEIDNITKYLNVFQLIFEKMGHISHYNMMKGSDN